MESVVLKREIGKLYFLACLMIALIVLLFYKKLLDSSLVRLLICCSFAFFGISIRAWFYYGKWKAEEREELSKKKMKDCISSYVFYGVISTVLNSFVYLMFYDNIKNMSLPLFLFISFFLFTYFGFSIENAMRFLRK